MKNKYLTIELLKSSGEAIRQQTMVFDEVVDFMLEASIEKLEMMQEKSKDKKVEQDANMLEKKFGTKAMQELGAMCIGTTIGIDTVASFVKYRNEIKKPLKTARPLKQFINELIAIADAGYDLHKAIEIMQNSEWQTINLDWIKKKMHTTQNGADLAQFGFGADSTQKLLQ